MRHNFQRTKKSSKKYLIDPMIHTLDTYSLIIMATISNMFVMWVFVGQKCPANSSFCNLTVVQHLAYDTMVQITPWNLNKSQVCA